MVWMNVIRLLKWLYLNVMEWACLCACQDKNIVTVLMEQWGGWHAGQACRMEQGRLSWAGQACSGIPRDSCVEQSLCSWWTEILFFSFYLALKQIFSYVCWVKEYWWGLFFSSPGNTGKVLWNGNWVTFLDTLLQMIILSETGHSLRLPTRIRSVCIDPSLHQELVHKYKDDTEGNESSSTSGIFPASLWLSKWPEAASPAQSSKRDV